MKKTVIIAIIIAVVLVTTIVGVIFINLNKEKISITASDFYTIMSEKGYIIKDAKSQFADYDYIKKVYLAISEDYSYQIEFYELQDDSYAIDLYNNNKSIFQSSKGNVSAETSLGLKNYSKYTLSSDGKYMLVSRIDNTLIYVNVDENYKDNVKAILDEIGY